LTGAAQLGEAERLAYRPRPGREDSAAEPPGEQATDTSGRASAVVNCAPAMSRRLGWLASADTTAG